jgi:vacuole morphology and inheritance protein 14
MLTIT